ncbi:YqhG family protein [Geobacillus thermoleovorans]|uniref:YqhG family protein n=1 Tax=Geobacillus thermoleovorans TaxID=33941 RepID=UPI003D212D6B
MQQHEIRRFVERYFAANGCTFVEASDDYLTVQLTAEMDKELMNRSFYWHYIERTGGVPQPMRLTLITRASERTDKLKGERLHFGAPRLHQLFRSAQKRGSFIRLYEEPSAPLDGNAALHPWLGMNVTISYECDRKKDEIVSLGLHLISGTIVESFHERMRERRLTPKIPDYCFTISPLIKPRSGIGRLEQYIRSRIAADDHAWADEARRRWADDLALLDEFYKDCEEKPECYYIEKEALEKQYKPRITVSVINGGLFYLLPRSS